MSGHLIREALALGAVPICPVDHGVNRLILADRRGEADPNKFGHQWVERGVPYWCVSQVLPAEEAGES